jgi:protein involved in polysaccharide export with SLBB domain
MNHRIRFARQGSIALALIAAAVVPVAAQQRETPEEQPIVLEAYPVPADVIVAGPLGTDYRVGRQDLLEIKVFDVDELNQTVRVADDGSITMPLLGRLVVAGKTKTELQDLIARLLEERYVRNPQVTVFVKEYESKKVAVTGAVKKPGSYEMLGTKTLLEMLSGRSDAQPRRRARRHHLRTERRDGAHLRQWRGGPSRSVRGSARRTGHGAQGDHTRRRNDRPRRAETGSGHPHRR